MEQKQNVNDTWIKGKTPWLVAAAALVVYVFTLNHWVTLASLPMASKITGWDWWSMTVQAPLTLCLTYPLRFAPSSLQPVLLNVFSAVCAAGALGFLARAVMFLPHDRTRDQRHRERSDYSLLSIPLAWVPPVLAAAALGFQLTFWENSIALTGESLNLLLFSFIICCFLEYRIDFKPWRLSAMGLFFGLSMSNNWAMVGYLPLFTAALIWVLGFRFFKAEVLGRLLGWGAVGLLLYLLLPLVESMSGKSGLGFFELLRIEVGLQKNILLNFPRPLAFLCSLYSILPVFAMGIRWPSTLGDTSVFGSILTHWMFRIVNVVFLVVCVWVMFDPVFSPRSKMAGVPFLTFYFLTALSIGYYSGYFMLVFGSEPVRTHRRSSEGGNGLGMLASGLICVAVVAVPAGLVYKNLPGIQVNNGPQLKNLADTIAQGLPKNGSIAVSDDSILLILVEAALKSADANHPQVLVDSRFLAYSSYHSVLFKRHPSIWPGFFVTNSQSAGIDRAMLRKMMGYLSFTNEMYYLHPPFGYFSESIYPAPHGLVYSMKPYLTNDFSLPIPKGDEAAYNMAYWNKMKAELTSWPKTAAVKEDADAAITDVQYAAKHYSVAANFMGVRLQREFTGTNLASAAHFNDAGVCFDLALEFNPDNDVARINREFHELVKTNHTPDRVKLAPAMEEKMRSKYIRWEDRLRECGPFDEPRFCFQTSADMAMSPVPLIRQATEYCMRAQQLEPSNVDVHIMLGNLFLKANCPERTLEIVATVKAMTNAASQVLAVKTEIVCMEAWAYAFQTNLPTAEKVLLKGQKDYPDAENLAETLAQIYLRNGMVTNALAAFDQQLRIAPNNSKALLNKGALCIQIKNYPMAVASLNRVVAAEPKNDAARMNRAIALLQNGQLDEAKADYKVLLELMPRFYRAYYGLAQIDYLKKDAKAAAENFELYQKYAPRNAKGQFADEKEAQMVAQKLQELKSGAAPR